MKMSLALGSNKNSHLSDSLHPSRLCGLWDREGNSHDHEGVKVLDAVQHRLGDVGAAVDEFPAVACGREKRVGWFSSRFVFIFIFMIILIGVARLGGVGLGNSERE
jgi:hypothetical protein